MLGRQCTCLCICPNQASLRCAAINVPAFRAEFMYYYPPLLLWSNCFSKKPEKADDDGLGRWIVMVYEGGTAAGKENI
eukprot:1136405-Pelagomonas_calceolata.AAC.4